jgi:hypothetical protein
MRKRKNKREQNDQEYELGTRLQKKWLVMGQKSSKISWMPVPMLTPTRIRQKVDTVKDRVEKEKECRAVSVSETKLSLHVQKMTGHVNNVVQDPMKKIKEGLSSKEQKLDHVQKMTGHVNNVVQDPMKKI